jgi:ribosome maturation factor RimP
MKNRESVDESFIKDAQGKVRDAGYELVDMDVSGGKHSRHLRFFADKPGGITAADCRGLSNLLFRWIEEKHPEFSEYGIEVSSPGLDRPLKTERDFERQLGRTVTVAVRDGEAVVEWNGTVEAVGAGTVTLSVAGKPRPIPLDALVRAKVKLQW